MIPRGWHAVTVTRYGPCPWLQHQSRPLGWQTQVVGAVGDELKVFKVDGLILVEIDAEQADVTDDDGEFT
jgi:hypothetical protein